MQFFTNFFTTCKRQLKARTFRQGMFSLALIALVLAIVIACNILFSTLPSIYTSFDLTEKKASEELSDTTIDYVSALERDVYVYYLAVPGTEDARTARVLERYAALSPRLHIEQINPELHPDFAATHGVTDELAEGSFIVKSDLRTKAIKLSDYYIEVFSLPVTYGILLCEGEETYLEFESALAQLSSSEANALRSITYGQYKQMMNESIPEVIMNLEAELTTTIDYVNLASLSTVYQIEGHGETALSTAVTARFTAENVSVKPLSLLDGIPSDCTSLMICAPTEDYTSSDIAILKNYLQSGGHLILLAGDVTKAPALYNMLSAEYGVSQQKGTVYDPDRTVGAALIVKPYQKDHAGINEILGGSCTVLLNRAGALQVTPRTGITVQPLLTSSAKAFLRTSSSTAMSKQDDDVEGVYNYAVAIEKPAANDKTTQIVWFSTESIINTSYNNSSGNGNYRYFLASALWNVDQFGSLTMDTAALNYISVLAVSQNTATAWLIVLAMLLPLTVLTVGIVRTAKRRTR